MLIDLIVPDNANKLYAPISVETSCAKHSKVSKNFGYEQRSSFKRLSIKIKKKKKNA